MGMRRGTPQILPQGVQGQAVLEYQLFLQDSIGNESKWCCSKLILPMVNWCTVISFIPIQD